MRSPFIVLYIAGSVLLGACTCSKQQAASAVPEEASKPETGASKTDSGESPRPHRVGSELNRSSPLGTNIAPVVDWSTNMPFVDQFKSSRPWVSGKGWDVWNDKRELDLDEQGWVRSLKPDQRARTLLLTGGHHPGGEYLLLHDGEGEIEFDYAVKVDEAKSRPGRYLLRLEKGVQLGMAISKTNPKNPLRNIRVLPPGGSCEVDDTRWCDASNPCPSGPCLPFEQTYEERIFYPKFLATLPRYSVLRFMPWMVTNESTARHWNERPKLDDARWPENGVPIEVMIRLAKRMRAEPWFSLSHRLDDEYVRKFAEQVRDSLPDEYRVWLEHSNEVWNPQFIAHEEVSTCKAGKSQDDQYGAAIVCHAERSDAIFATWREVFGEAASRVIRVLGSQSASPWASELALSHRDVHERVDALAIAPYFGLIAMEGNQREIAALTMDELLERTEKEVLPKAIEQMRQQAEIAKRFGVDLVAYEGGQHFVAILDAENDEKINGDFDAINHHPRMKDFYLQYFAAWREAGGKLFVNFIDCDTDSKYGRYGIIEYLDQPRSEAPKYQAVMEFIEKNPRWW